jgi:hypothetical protein
MAVVWASVIAVLGTLGGATASYLFQGKISERNESKARDERLRQERLAAYSSFAGAMMDLRGIQYDRGRSRMTVEAQQLDRSSIRAESSRLRSVAWTAFYRFKLTSPDYRHSCSSPIQSRWNWPDCRHRSAIPPISTAKI